jgi:hypothetical protein
MPQWKILQSIEDFGGLNAYAQENAAPLCANVLETLTPIEFSVEGGEAEEHGVPERVGLRG